jgi:hypothetical protein
MQIFEKNGVELTVLELQKTIDQQTVIVSVNGVDIVISFTGIGFVNVHESGNYKQQFMSFDKSSQAVRINGTEVDVNGLSGSQNPITA